MVYLLILLEKNIAIFSIKCKIEKSIDSPILYFFNVIKMYIFFYVSKQ